MLRSRRGQWVEHVEKGGATGKEMMGGESW